jgi:bacteriocin-like protein
MEKIMSKTNDTSRKLTNNELNAVSGGYVYDATYVVGIVASQTDGALRGRYQLRLDEANSLLSAQH